MKILEQYRNIRQLKKVAKNALNKIPNFNAKRFTINVKVGAHNLYYIFYIDKETGYISPFRLPFQEWIKDNGFYIYYNMQYFIQKAELYKKRCERGFYEK